MLLGPKVNLKNQFCVRTGVKMTDRRHREEIEVHCPLPCPLYPQPTLLGLLSMCCRMSTRAGICFICREDLDTGPVVVITERGIRTLIEVSQKRRLTEYKSFLQKCNQVSVNDEEFRQQLEGMWFIQLRSWV